MTMRPITAACLFASACFAQQPEFEVATIKPSSPPQMGRIMMGVRGGPGSDDPGRFTCMFCNVKMLLSLAYDVREFQISGPPALDTEHFEIVAKVPSGATREQFRLMLQSLLADRFKLKLHHDSKEMQSYQLVVAKGGPKLKESNATPPSPDSSAPPGPGGPPRADKDGYPILPSGGRSMMAMTPGRARMQGVRETTDQLARRLSSLVGRPVTDSTGLTGKYDYVLSFAPEEGRGMIAGVPPPPPGADGPGGAFASPPQDAGPTIFTALQEQLGLRLDQKKGPVDLLIVDHVEKVPTEN
jgi:uncharacterized protein (TIGR03435 family)